MRFRNRSWRIRRTSAPTRPEAPSHTNATSPTPSDPPTLPTVIDGREVRQVSVFDPALTHFGRAYRLGGLPHDEPLAAQREWSELQVGRSRVVLEELISSDVGKGLVLRGGWLLHLWFSDESREPRDLDFVDVSGITPEAFVHDVRATIASSVALPRAGLLVDEVATTDIWTYERAIGRRILIPWRHGAHTGAVQVDVTFGEEIPGAIESAAIGPYAVSCVSKETSLVWKLLWLLTDTHPQGKDFFDAVLLAKHVQLSVPAVDWLRRALGREWPGLSGDIVPHVLSSENWGHFASEFPEFAARSSAIELHDELRRNLIDRTPQA